MWLLGVLGLVPGADKYALLFGAWVAVTELIPYLGPWLGAIPPVIYALVVHPVSAALGRRLLFLVIHQVEGHIVVPNVMGSALRLHPLLVIFGLLAGGEIYGLARDPGRAAAARRGARGVGVLLRAGRARAVGGGRPRAGRGRGRARRRCAGAARSPTRRRRRGDAAARRAGRRAPLRRHVALEPTDLEVRPRRGARARRAERRRASRRCSRSSPARSSRARARSSGARACASAGCRSGRRTTAACRRAQNLELFARLEGEPADAAALLERLELPDDDRPASTLSVGNRQRLDLAISLLARPATCCCSTSRPRRSTRASGGGCGRPRAASATPAARSCFVTQNLDDLERVADRVVALLDGPCRLRRAGRRVPDLRSGRFAAMRPAWLVLRKDLLVLRRSPALLGVLIAYPLVIALLIGLTAAYANAKPRVALRRRGRHSAPGHGRRGRPSTSTT